MLNGLVAACLALAVSGVAPALAEGSSRDRAQVHTDLGSAYFSRGQFGVALEELNEAVKADDRYAPAYNVRALVYMELREYDQAEENFTRSLRLDPADSDTQNNYGWFLCQRGKVDDSIKHFMAALKNPLYASPDKAYLNAGVCLRKKGDEQGAEDYLLRSIKLQPLQPQALFNLADIYYKRGNYAEAKGYAGRLLEFPNPSAENLWLGVRIAHRLGDRDAEGSYGLLLRRLFPDSREAAALRNEQYDYSGGGQ
jgi:type IV pilus assembly protein PilF